MAKTKDEIWAGVHNEALQRFYQIESTLRDERLCSLEDRRFYSIAGAQWEGSMFRDWGNKPRIEVNKVHRGVMRIINEYRNNRISVEYIPKDGTEADELSETCNGLYRADEIDSHAEEAMDNAFEEAVGGGFGAWRLRTELEDEYAEDEEEEDYQRIRFEPIFDADSTVFFDLNSKRQDKSDAMFAFVLTAMTPEAYEAEYNDDPSTWPKSVQMTQFDWSTEDAIYVAEYYVVEKRKEKIFVYADVLGNEEEYARDDLEDEETALMIAATGMTLVREKSIKRRKVHKWILSGGGVLEDSGYIAGNNIPIVPVYGKRWFVDNKERFMGAVRLAKDSQRLKNMQLSKLAEISAYSAARKPIMTPEQIAGHENVWGNDNVENYRYLLLNPVTDGQGNEQPMGPIGYSEPPDIPQPLAALLQITEQDVADLMGMQDAAEQMTPNISGVAIELIQTRVDQNNFIYMSNMAKAVKRCGEIWLGMARDVYVERGRKMKTVAENNDIAGITLNTPTIDEETSATIYANDLERAKFDVAVTVGPSSESKRAGTVRSLVGMLQFAQNDPEMSTVLTSMAMMNMEGEGLKDVRKFFRTRLVKMGAVEPNEEEMQAMEAELQAQEPDANAALLLAEAEKSKTQAAVNAAKVANTEADTQLKQAQAGKVLADIDSQGKSDALKVLNELREPAPGQR
jgi:hypothetical protein